MNFLWRRTKPVFYIILAAFVLMAGVEWPLLNNAMKGKEKDFYDKLFYVTADYEQHCVKDSLLMNAMTDDNAAIRIIRSTIKQGLDSVFLANAMPVDYVLAIGKSKTQGLADMQMKKAQLGWAGKNLIWSGDTKNDSSLIATKARVANLGPAASRIYYVKIFFPSKPYYIFKELLPLIILDVLTLVILFACFLALIAIIKRQNMLAGIKNDFINNMTHELKTPLFTISIASKMLAEQEPIRENKKYVSYIESIQQETGRLTGLVDKLLQTSAIEKKQLQPDKTDLDLHALIRSAVNDLELIRQQENAAIELSLQAVNHCINADKINIESVIFSLADNAFKYSNGPAHITIATKNDGNNIVLSFMDKGRGIDMETKELIFDRFFRAHTGNLHDVKGYGIGLSYVKSIIEAHNGSINVKSAPGKGSEFILVLPCINNGNK